MKAGWIKKTLGDLTTKIGSGATPLGGEEAYKTSGISLIRSLNVYDDGFRDKKLARIDEEQASRLSNVVVETGDVLLNITGASVARCCVAPGDFLPARVNQHVAIIRPVKSTIESAFLHYLLISRVYKERLLHTGEEGGSTRQAITKAQLQDFSIEFPESLPEQQRIVTLLDEAFDGIATAKANAEKNLQNARAIFESHLESVYSQHKEGWVKTSLENCCEQIFAGGDVPKDCVAPERTEKFSVPIFSNGEKNDGLYGFTAEARVTKPSITISARGTIGFSVIRTEPYLPVVRLIVLIPNAALVNISFLYYRVIGMNFENTGTSIPQLTVPNIKGRTLFLPSLSLQTAIVAKLDDLRDEIQRLESIYQQKLTALDELKKSLLHRAFNGEL